ncbi:hypothetical protein, partial [Staphylococcus aureus]|uniref:hypothetical protein n=1 Tax=Staphylococcus aureus TaxID=1280 RepID=UPI002109C2BF
SFVTCVWVVFGSCMVKCLWSFFLAFMLIMFFAVLVLVWFFWCFWGAVLLERSGVFFFLRTHIKIKKKQRVREILKRGLKKLFYYNFLSPFLCFFIVVR